MNNLLFIFVNADGGFYYDLFYLFAFLVGYFLLLWIGVKRKYNLVAWLLVLAGTRFFFIIGTKLFSYSEAEWQVLLTEHYFPATSGKTLLGGLLLVAIGFFLLKKILRLKTETLDAFAFVIPLSIALQRPGCFLAGCCYGNPTTVPWGVQYLPGTLPHYHQFQAGLIQAQEMYSLPVHPSQLYEALNGLLVVGLLLLLRRHIKAPGNLLTASILLYCFFRFFLEFFRSPLAHTTGGSPAGGLITLQWGILVVIGFLGSLFFYREKHFTPEASPEKLPSVTVTVLVLLSLVVITWSLRDWFTFTELLALNMALYPAIVLVSWYVFGNIFVPQFRWVALVTLLLPLFLMSQTLPLSRPDSTTNISGQKSYHTFKIGFGEGNFQNSYFIGHVNGCGREGNVKYYLQDYTLGAAGYAITQQKGNKEVTYGLNAFLGNHQETDITSGMPGETHKTTLFGVNPYIKLDKKWYGLGAGLHVGNLRYILEDKEESGSGMPGWGSRKTPVYPQFNVRIGPTRIAFVDFRLADQFPSALPGMRYQASIGSGFGIRNGSYARFGTNGAHSFVSGNFVFQNRLVVEPLYLWGDPQEFLPQEKRQHQFGIGLHYRFNQK
ncbi:prolipoprotein diacylglyceryl transferase family protein [Adhaeribacter radiodurans]|uniref:Prolipoprotein diacylglyceryl transferase n=1 Tax=Adhaeribacter radiodurans TaxID=2745197 RepID=A0A7L7L7M7_9BACT|nr:prolipoprotein diacylglyceryl transferase family protein [Adhaeribacter radiodurans]QMU28841.1 prolipoprotein diacylglyceryl transferase [Adhaeribacter radiodurans]